jgi:single-strand DNA-binding protein
MEGGRMLNQSILVGRLTKDPEIRETADGKQVSTITIAVARNFKSQETGEYESDFLRCTLWEGMAQNTVQYCKKGSTIAVKARLATKRFVYDDEKYFEYPEIIAEKISFIST